MRLSDRYRPKTLSEVVGQMPVRLLRAFAVEPYPTDFLLTGGPGTGKTSAAFALAADLGLHDEHPDLVFSNASEVGVDYAKELLMRRFRYVPTPAPNGDRGWHVWIVDELEVLSPSCQTFLKTALEKYSRPQRLITIATSNGADKLQKALLQRFSSIIFSAGEMFAQAVQERLAYIWRQECGDEPMPAGWQDWGWDDLEFSMRVALDSMQRRILTSGAVLV